MSSKVLLLTIWLLLAGGPAWTQTTVATRPETGFLKRTVAMGQRSYSYRVYVPENYKPDQAYPVVLYLHGVGEWGQDNEQQMGGPNLGSVIQLYSNKETVFSQFLAVFPQEPAPEIWYGEGAEQALKALEQTVAEFKADPTRLYVTGLSMGGYGAWYLAAKYPGKFAAIAPAAGGVVVPDWFSQTFPSPMLTAYTSQPLYAYAATAKAIGNTPIWIFHGAKDEVVPVTEARQMAAALKDAGHPAQYTEYEAEGHFIADKMYTDPAFWQWLLTQRLPSSAPPAAATAPPRRQPRTARARPK